MSVPLTRGLIVLSFAAIGWFTLASGFGPAASASVGALVGLFLVSIEIFLRRASAIAIIGGAVGAIAGLVAFWLLTPALLPNSSGFVVLTALVALVYLGSALGAAKAGPLLAMRSSAREAGAASDQKICDTSVIIDGRIADICDTGFLEGTLVIPQFVLRELQLVADSSDSLKRHRGRRGLDILKRLQSVPNLRVEIAEQDFPQVRDVDMKLIELAKVIGGKILTNDFNLNKVAQVRGVEVLNINELANSLRPVVLPGENMQVFILKEGKEHNQGVAYLDDGTMVVVDNARRLISKTIDITVTSVLQTTAGKMIFGRYDERQHAIHERADRPATREPQRAPVGPPAA